MEETKVRKLDDNLLCFLFYCIYSSMETESRYVLVKRVTFDSCRFDSQERNLDLRSSNPDVRTDRRHKRDPRTWEGKRVKGSFTLLCY